MRIYVLTQEDAFYIPLILDHLLAQRRDVVGVGVVPGELRTAHVGRYVRMMGPRDFLLQSLNLVVHRGCALIGRLVPLSRSFSVAHAARRARVPLEAVPNVNSPAFVDRLRARGVDLVVSVACPQKLKREVLGTPRHGCINLHGALLPRYQGLLPSFWVLARGERETGVTVHYMDESIDHGDIILQERVPIEDRDTVHSLVHRSKVRVGRYALVRAVALIERGEAPRRPMDLSEASRFSYPDDQSLREFRARGRRFI